MFCSLARSLDEQDGRRHLRAHRTGGEGVGLQFRRRHLPDLPLRRLAPIQIDPIHVGRHHEQVGFQLLRRLVDLQDELDVLPQGDPARADKERELQQGESFLEYLIELQTAYGISNFF